TTRQGRCSPGPTPGWDRTGRCTIFGTAAYRMARDPQMPLTDVQWVLGHAHLSTTQRYLNPVIEDVIAGLLAFHARQRDRDPAAPPAPGYRAESLQTLFGEDQV